MLNIEAARIAAQRALLDAIARCGKADHKRAARLLYRARKVKAGLADDDLEVLAALTAAKEKE